MKNFRNLLNKAIRKRELESEKGSINESIEMLKELLLAILESKSRFDKTNYKQYGETLSQLALTYWHNHQYLKAKAILKKCFRIAILTGDRKLLATTYRNYSRPELWKTTYELTKAMENAEKARVIAKSEHMIDIVWFTHGLMKLYQMFGKPTSIIRKLVWEEVYEYITVSRKFKDKISRNAWLDGLLMDIADAYGLLSESVLKIAYRLAKFQKMARRVEQVQVKLDTLAEKKKGKV